jgi:hypothetical protein
MAAIAGSIGARGRDSRGRSAALARRRVDAHARQPVPWAVILIALILCQFAILWSASTNAFTLYGDSRAHLDIARRLTDGLTPGFAQLGSVWLPLPHLLMAPFTAIDTLWHSAAAGAIVCGASFVYSAVRIYSFTQEWLQNKLAAWCAFLVYAINLDLLYVQTTALTEPVLLAFFIGAAYHLLRWTRTDSWRDLLLAGFLVACATLTRYEGWALFAVGIVVVAVWTRHHQKSAHATQANVVLFAAVGGYGIILWLLYNLIIFHDPLQFLHSSFSSGAQQASLAQAGLLPTKGNIVESTLTYGWAIIDIAGIATVVIALAGIASGLLARANRGRLLVALALLATPVLLNVASLWLGQSTIRVPQRAPFGYWNDRYGLMALPLLAFGAALLVQRWRLLAPAVIIAVAAGTAFSAAHTPVAVTDGRSGISSASAGKPELTAALLQREYTGGGILADDASASGVMFGSGLNLKEFLTIGFHPYYDEALLAPARSVHWVLAYDGDSIAQAMADHPDRYAAFHMVIHEGRIRLFALADAAQRGPAPR